FVCRILPVKCRFCTSSNPNIPPMFVSSICNIFYSLKHNIMTTTEKTVITVEANVNAPVAKVWELWSNTDHVTQWNNAAPDWHTPHAANDLRTGGNFLYRMEAKDGSFGFDFGGVYDAVEEHAFIAYTMGDGRKVKNTFTSNGD